MTALEFNPDSVFKGQKKLYDILIDLNNGVERPLRNASLPEMPANVQGSVQSNIQAAITAMSTARVAVAGVAGELKRRSYDLVEHDDPTKMPWWVKPGDFMVAAAEFTGTDIIYKTSQAVSGEGSWKDAGMSGVNFGLNFVGGTEVKAAWKGIKGLRGARAVDRAAQVAIKEPKAGNVAQHAFRGEWKKGKFQGYHHEPFGPVPVNRKVVAEYPNGTYAVEIHGAPHNELGWKGPTSGGTTPIKGTLPGTNISSMMFPRTWSKEKILALATQTKGLTVLKTYGDGMVDLIGHSDGVWYVVKRFPDGTVKSVYPAVASQIPIAMRPTSVFVTGHIVTGQADDE